MSLLIQKRIPTVEEFNYLRTAAEWPLLEDSLTKEGLSRSLFGVCVFSDTNLVGMGRIVGDNAIYFHISDVIVHPDHQGEGLGKLIMAELMAYIQTVAGKNTNIGLMSSKGREVFYEKLGFTRRPNEKFGAGMIKVL